LEVPDEDLLDLHPAIDVVGQYKFEQCSSAIPDGDGEVLDDEVIIICSSSPTSELDVFQPYSRVCLPGVFGDVSGRSEARWEWRFLDATTEGLRARAVRTGALVAILIARSATTPWGRFLVLSLRLVGFSCVRSSPVDISAVAVPLP
jgi:hypothetical protein